MHSAPGGMPINWEMGGILYSNETSKLHVYATAWMYLKTASETSPRIPLEKDINLMNSKIIETFSPVTHIFLSNEYIFITYIIFI